MNQFDGVVDRIMAAYGGSATLLIPKEGIYVDGEYIPAATLEKPVKILLDEYPQAGAGDKSQMGTLILEGDKRCLLQPLDKSSAWELPYEIQANKDTLRINGVEWKIIRMKEINPSGINSIIFELHIRK